VFAGLSSHHNQLFSSSPPFSLFFFPYRHDFFRAERVPGQPYLLHLFPSAGAYWLGSDLGPFRGFLGLECFSFPLSLEPGLFFSTPLIGLSVSTLALRFWRFF